MQRVLLILLTVGMIYGEDLFFSEYAEGSSSNKYVEIYNGTGADVDLSSYSLQGTNNGTSWGDNGERDVSLSGTLASGDVYVIAADQADAAILAEADLALAYESPVHHNGDDGIVHNIGPIFIICDDCQFSKRMLDIGGAIMSRKLRYIENYQ